MLSECPSYVLRQLLLRLLVVVVVCRIVCFTCCLNFRVLSCKTNITTDLKTRNNTEHKTPLSSSSVCFSFDNFVALAILLVFTNDDLCMLSYFESWFSRPQL